MTNVRAVYGGMTRSTEGDQVINPKRLLVDFFLKRLNSKQTSPPWALPSTFGNFRFRSWQFEVYWSQQIRVHFYRIVMDQEVFRKVHPQEYLKRFLANNVRPDGRSPSTARNVKITTGSIGTAVGSAMVKLGSTTTVAGLDAVVTEPSPNAPDQGVLNITVELLSTASWTSRASRSDDALVLTDYLRRLIGPHVDLSTLCLEPGKLVWSLHLSVYCIDNDGNLEDAMLIASITALQNVLLPSVRLVENGKKTDEANDTGNISKGMEDVATTTSDNDSTTAVATSERTVPLDLNSYSLSVSFSVLADKILIDPSAEEESAQDSRITFVMKPNGELRAVLKPGGKHMPHMIYKSCLAQATERLPYLVSRLAEVKNARSTPA